MRSRRWRTGDSAAGRLGHPRRGRDRRGAGPLRGNPSERAEAPPPTAAEPTRTARAPPSGAERPACAAGPAAGDRRRRCERRSAAASRLQPARRSDRRDGQGGGRGQRAGDRDTHGRGAPTHPRSACRSTIGDRGRASSVRHGHRRHGAGRGHRGSNGHGPRTSDRPGLLAVFGGQMTPGAPKKVVLLGMMTRIPVAGVVWQTAALPAGAWSGSATRPTTSRRTHARRRC